MPAAALLSRKRRSRDRLGDDEQIVEIERGMPTGVVFAIAADRHIRRAPLERFDARQRLLHLALRAHDTDEILHVLLQRFLDLIWPIGRAGALEGGQRDAR